MDVGVRKEIAPSTAPIKEKKSYFTQNPVQFLTKKKKKNYCYTQCIVSTLQCVILVCLLNNLNLLDLPESIFYFCLYTCLMPLGPVSPLPTVSPNPSHTPSQYIMFRPTSYILFSDYDPDALHLSTSNLSPTQVQECFSEENKSISLLKFYSIQEINYLAIVR